MKLATIFFLHIVMAITSEAQEVVYKFLNPLSKYNTLIFHTNESLPPMKGSLIEVRDSSIIVSNTTVQNWKTIDQVQFVELFAPDIEKISINRNNKAIRGLAFGAMIGATIGAIVGFAHGSDPKEDWFAFTATEKAAIGGIVLGVTGGVAGIVTGSLITVNIPIGGRVENLTLNRDRLKLYTPTK